MIERLRTRAEQLMDDVHATLLAALDRRTPLTAKALGVVVASFALSPIELAPDYKPVLDLLVVPVGLLLIRMVPDAVMHEAHTAVIAPDRPRGRTVAFAIVLLWLSPAARAAWQLAGFAS